MNALRKGREESHPFLWQEKLIFKYFFVLHLPLYDKGSVTDKRLVSLIYKDFLHALPFSPMPVPCGNTYLFTLVEGNLTKSINIEINVTCHFHFQKFILQI